MFNYIAQENTAISDYRTQSLSQIVC